MRRILYDTDKQELAEELIKLDYRNSPAIVCTAKGETIAINDSIDYKPKNIKLYGKSIQDGTPSIETPIEVEPLGKSGSVGGKVLNANMFNKEKCVINQNPSFTFPYTNNNFTWVETDIKVKQGDILYIYCSINNVFNAQKTFYINDRVSSSSGYITKVTENKVTVRFDGTLYVRMDLITSGECTFDNLIVSRVPITEFEPYTEQPFTALTPNGLHGIPLGTTIPSAIANSPIHLSGVYHDGEQYWIGDTENEGGKDVQRIERHYITSNDKVGKSGLSTDELSNFYLETDFVLESEANKPSLIMSNIASQGILQRFNVLNTAFTGGNYGRRPYICVGSDVASTVDEFKTMCVENGVYIDYVLIEPIVTDTDTQYDVVMNYPNTTIVNDEGAYMEVEYVADTKNYIDNNIKNAIAELQALALER